MPDIAEQIATELDSTLVLTWAPESRAKTAAIIRQRVGPLVEACGNLMELHPVCDCDDEPDRETGYLPPEGEWRPTNFWGNPVWRERCEWCELRAALAAKEVAGE